MTQTPLTARIEVFRPGTFTPMSGEPITYSAADLKAIADAYSPETAPAPVVVGHPAVDAPAFGWVQKFEFDAQSERLIATLHQIEPQFAEMVKDGRFKKVSMAFFAPDQPHNPIPKTWYPKHVGFLGATAPAVSGLKNAAFADGAGVVFTANFGAPAAEETASLMRSLRDFLIEKFGLESADKALPSWRIDWLGEIDDQPKALGSEYSENPKPKEDIVSEPKTDPKVDAAFAARDAALAKREAAIAHTEHVAFAEGLIAEGRMLPALKDKVVAIFDALPSHAAVSFAEGAEKLTAGAALREVLSSLPKVVAFGETDLGEGPDKGKAVAFASDGKAVDPVGLALHQKAVEYQSTHPGVDYLTAVNAVS